MHERPMGDRMDESREHSTVPELKPSSARGLLPGVAGICLYLLLVSMLNAFAAAQGKFGGGAPRTSVLGICSLMVIGVFGLLRSKRWGWALVSGGCLIMAIGFFYGFHATHFPAYIVQGLFALLFFLYLARPEVLGRMK